MSAYQKNTCRDAFSIKEEHQSFKNEQAEEFYRFKQVFFAEINSMKSDTQTTDAPTGKNTSYCTSEKRRGKKKKR